MKRLAYLSTVIAVLAASAQITPAKAEDVTITGIGAMTPKKVKAAEAAKAPKWRPELKRITINGRLEKIIKKGKDGKPDKITYVIIADSGQQIQIPPTKKSRGKDAPPPIDIEGLEKANVLMTANGLSFMKAGREHIAIKEVLTLGKAGSAKKATTEVAAPAGTDAE